MIILPLEDKTVAAGLLYVLSALWTCLWRRPDSGRSNRRRTQQTPSMSVYCWASVCDAGPTLNQHGFATTLHPASHRAGLSASNAQVSIFMIYFIGIFFKNKY